MSKKDNNLWGKLPKFESIGGNERDTLPMKILKEQAAYLDEMTGTLTAVAYLWDWDLDKATIMLAIIEPKTDGKMIAVLAVQYPMIRIEPFPARIINCIKGETYWVKKEKTLKERISKILRSREMKNIIKDLLNIQKEGISNMYKDLGKTILKKDKVVDFQRYSKMTSTEK